MPFLNKTTPSPEGKRKKKHSSDTVINNQEENADLENISPRLPNINRSIRSVNSGVRRRSIGHPTLPPTGNGWLEELYSGDYGETHDDFLHDNARQKIISVGAEPNSEVSVARMISRMAWRVMNRVVTELILEVLPVKGISVFRGHYDELCAICHDNSTPRRKLLRLIHALEELKEDVKVFRKQNTLIFPGVIDNSLRQLPACLEVVIPWLSSASKQWSQLSHSLHDVRNNSSLPGRLSALLNMAETVLAAPQLQALTGKERLGYISKNLNTLRQIMGQIQLMEDLPGDADISDYMNILTGNVQLQNSVDTSLLQLAQALPFSMKNYPGEGTLANKVSWLADALSEPARCESLTKYLNQWIPDGRANLFVDFLRFTGQLRYFPASDSLARQVLWLLAQTKTLKDDSPLLAWVNNFQASLNAAPSTLKLLNHMLSVANGTGSWSLMMHDFAIEMLPATAMLAGQVATNTLLPPLMVKELEKFYQESSAEESWFDFCTRMVESIARVSTPYIMGGMMNNPLAAVTAQYAATLQKKDSFDETLKWFVTHEPGKDKTLQFFYSKYLNAALMWQIWQAFRGSSPEESESLLRQLLSNLKECEVVQSYPQLEWMIDLLPLLPALKEAQHIVGDLPDAGSWLEWSNQWVEALAGSQNSSLLKLQGKLSLVVENWLTNAALSASKVVVDKAVSTTRGIVGDAAQRVSSAVSTIGEKTSSAWAIWQSIRHPLNLPTATAEHDRTTFTSRDVDQAIATGDPQKASAIFELLPAEIQAEYRLRSTTGLVSDVTPAATSKTTEPGPVTITGSTSDVSHKKKSVDLRTTALVTGVSFDVIGPLLIAWGLWQARQAGKPKPSEENIEMTTLTDTIQEPSESVGNNTLHSALIEQLPLPEVNISLKSRLWEQKTPLLLGLMMTGVGMGLLGYYCGTDSSAKDDVKPHTADEIEYQRILALFEDKEVPDLDFLFYGEWDEDVQKVGATNDRLTTSEEISRYKRDASDSRQINSLNIPEHVEILLRDTGMKNNPSIRAWFKIVDDYIAKNTTRLKPEGVNIIRLLRTLEEERVLNIETREQLAPVTTGLWYIAENLSDRFGQKKVRQFKAIFPKEVVKSNLPGADTYSENKTSPTSIYLSDTLDSDSMVKSMLKTLDILEESDAPILDIHSFMAGFIQKEILNFEKNNGKKTGLTPESIISITAEHLYYNQLTEIEAPPLLLKCTVMEIVTGQFLYKLREEKSSATKTYQHAQVTFEKPHEDVLHYLLTLDLQKILLEALSAYRNDESKRGAVKSLYRMRLIDSCVAYLEDSKNKNINTAFTQAVNDFLEGKIQAQEVFYDGGSVNGVFMLPAGLDGALLLSVDEPTFFHGIFDSYYDFNGREIKRAFFPANQELKDWIHNKTQASIAREVEQRSLANFQELRGVGIFYDTPVEYISSRFSFETSSSQTDLLDRLFNGWIDRLEKDIDYFIFSIDEQSLEAKLEVGKTLLMILSMVVNVAVPGSGTLISRIGLFLANLTIDTLYVTASLAQAESADRPEDSRKFTQEAMLASLVGGGAAIHSAGSLSKGAITAARSLYQRSRMGMRNLISKAMGKANWIRLRDTEKIKLLVKKAKVRPSALSLVKMTNTQTVEKVISNNLELDVRGIRKTDFIWDDEIKTELNRIETLLASDAKLLTETQRQIKNMLEQSKTMSYRSLSGEPTNRAAAWIAKESGGVTDEVKSNIKQVLANNQDTNLLEMSNLDRIQSELYPSEENTLKYRPSGNSKILGSDIARDSFMKMLGDLSTRNLSEKELSAALYIAVKRYKPFIEGNERTACTLYALSRLKMGEDSFKVLDNETELLLMTNGKESAVHDNFSALGVQLNPAQLDELKIERRAYLDNIENILERPSKVEFINGKGNPSSLDTLTIVNKDMSELELTKIYNNPFHTITPEQRGALSILIEEVRTTRIIESSLLVTNKYSKILGQDSIQTILAPQPFLLKAANSLEVGQCLPLTLSLAVALKNNKVTTLFRNFYRAAAHTEAPTRHFIEELGILRSKFLINRKEYSTVVKFSEETRGTIKQISQHLNRSSETQLFCMNSKNHAMMVGVSISDNGLKTFHFYDPNIGLFNYTSAKNLEKALKQTVGTKNVAAQYEAFGNIKNPTYELDLINTEELGDLRISLPDQAPDSHFTVRTLSDEVTTFICNISEGSRLKKRTVVCSVMDKYIERLVEIQEALLENIKPQAGSYQFTLDQIDVLEKQNKELGLKLNNDIKLMKIAKGQIVNFHEQLIAFQENHSKDAANLSIQARATYTNYISSLLNMAYKIRYQITL